MKDPRRLLDGGVTDAERALLRAAASEEPPSDGPMRLAAALGLPAVAPARAPEPGATRSTAPPPAAIESAASKVALNLKWLALAGSGAAVIAAVIVHRGDGEPPRDAAAAPASAAPAPVAPAAPAPVAPAPATGTAPDSTVTRDATAAAGKSIASEIESLDRARARLQGGDARAALGALDAYRHAHPTGMLQQEASLLRIEALVRGGDVAAARQVARAFLRDYPRSPHVARVRALLGRELDAP